MKSITHISLIFLAVMPSIFAAPVPPSGLATDLLPTTSNHKSLNQVYPVVQRRAGKPKPASAPPARPRTPPSPASAAMPPPPRPGTPPPEPPMTPGLIVVSGKTYRVMHAASSGANIAILVDNKSQYTAVRYRPHGGTPQQQGAAQRQFLADVNAARAKHSNVNAGESMIGNTGEKFGWIIPMS